MSSRIEQIIEEIEEYIDSCKPQTLSKANIIVNKEEIEELLRELRMKTPEEIRRYQKILANKDAILADAQAKADAMIKEANIHTTELINEHEIMQQALINANEMIAVAAQQAQQIVDNATIDANNIRMGAMQYTDDMLGNLQNIIQGAISNYSAKYESLIASLQNCYDIVTTNRSELAPTISGEALSSEEQ
ncbi:MAG: ATPase [Lachnospiraceae bacterium]|nr:ATPase [Lachnospiraceae bacterium]